MVLSGTQTLSAPWLRSVAVEVPGHLILICGSKFSLDGTPSRPDATEAMSVLDASENVELLFTDVVLPGAVNGPLLAKRAVAARPGLKVLFTSGYTEDAILNNGRLDSGVDLLSKPYRRHELAKKLREVLDRAV